MKKLLTTPAQILLAIFALILPGAVAAQDAMFTIVSGDTTLTFTEEEYLALPTIEVKTENEWFDGMISYIGPSGRSLLDMVPHEGATTVTLYASDDYSVPVPIEDYYTYDVVFAHTADGRRLSRRGKGPIWVMYPLSENSELQDPLYNSRLIYQLVRMEIN